MTKMSVQVAVHPPVRAAGEPAGDVAALITLEGGAAAASPPAHLAVVRVGEGDAALEAVAEALRAAAGPDDRLVFPGGSPASAGGAGSPRGDAMPTLAAALEAARRALTDLADGPRLGRVLVVTREPLDEDPGTLEAAMAALAAAQVGLDVFIDGEGPEPGALARLAASVGGDVVDVRETPSRVASEMVRRLEWMHRQRAAGLRVEMTFPQGVEPGALFRVAPGPVWLGAVRLATGDRTLRLDAGLVCEGRPTAFLVTASVPQRRAGQWRLVDVTVLDEGGRRARQPVVLSVSDEPGAQRWAAADVVAARDRCEPAAWLEEVTRALPEGDHRRVAAMLERLQRRLVELDRRPATALVLELRHRFLRSGLVDPTELDRLRRLAF